MRRYRCAACGNLTRFDVVATRRTRCFHHYSLGGDLTLEDVEVLDEVVERVTCRWCGATDTAIETMPAQSGGPARRPATPADRGPGRPVTVSLVTVPEALLVPLLDTAAALLAELEPDEVPFPSAA